MPARSRSNRWPASRLGCAWPARSEDVMPEEQQPFVHQDGSTSPAMPQLGWLTSHSLANLINLLDYRRTFARQGDPRTAAHRCEPYDQAIAILVMLRQPGFN